MSAALPSGWGSAPLSALGTWLGGGTPSKAVPEYWTDGTIPWVSPKDMKRLVIDSAQDQITEAALQRSATNLVPARSVLMVTRSGILEHTFPVSVNAVPVTINQDLKAWTPSEVDCLYAAYYLRARQQDVLRECSKDGTTVSSIDFDQLAKFPMLVAPRAEQQRIVSRIEELFSEIDEGERALERVGRLVERYRQSVLEAAVTGELTREWRERRGIEARADSAAELPTGWRAAPLSELGEFGRGKSKHRPRNDPKLFGGPYPFLQTGAVRASRGRIAEYDSTYSEFGLAQSKLWPAGTVCITIAANIAASGVLAFDACFPDSVVGLVPAPEVSGEYVEYFIRTARESLDRYAPATAQKNINLDILEKVLVPLPPPDEQAVVCSRVREVLSVVDALELTLEERRRQAQALRQSILKAAFSGQLVPQDPRDEPASALLARLAALSAEAPAPKRRGRPRRQPAAAL